MLGSWQHCSFPIDVIDEGTFQEGLGFDGSSIRGWQGIHMSDMMAIPDPDTFCLDPFFAKPTVSIIADIFDPVKKEKYSRDPRFVAQKAEEYLKQIENSPIPALSDRNRSFLFLMKFAMNKPRAGVITRLILRKAPGIQPGLKNRI